MVYYCFDKRLIKRQILIKAKGIDMGQLAFNAYVKEKKIDVRHSDLSALSYDEFYELRKEIAVIYG